MKSRPTPMKKTKLPVFDEKVNLLFPRDLCEQAKPVAHMLGISVTQLFTDFCKAALASHSPALSSVKRSLLAKREAHLLRQWQRCNNR